MTTIDVAERKSRWRAGAFYLFAGVLVAVLWFGLDGPRLPEDERAFFQGLWFGVMLGSAINLMPFARWLKPGSAVARLLDDEGVREHRRMSCTAGFWAATAAGLATALAVRTGAPLDAFDAVRTVATAAMAAALVSFATLELRAARG